MRENNGKGKYCLPAESFSFSLLVSLPDGNLHRYFLPSFEQYKLSRCLKFQVTKFYMYRKIGPNKKNKSGNIKRIKWIDLIIIKLYKLT